MDNFQKNQERHSSMLASASGRAEYIRAASMKNEDGTNVDPEDWQDVAMLIHGTESNTWEVDGIAREMASLVFGQATHYAVLFNLEFLEVLVKEKGVSPENIVFFGDRPLENKIAEVMYGVQTALVSKTVMIHDGGFDKTLFGYTLRQGVRDMNFNKLAVIMNPPYQINNDKGGGTTHASALYNVFIETILNDLSPNYLVSINPSRWMVGGRGLDDFRDKMLADHRIKKIVHFPGDKEVFSTVQIKGGVNYFLWQKDYNGQCEFVVGNSTTNRYLDEFDIVLQDNQAMTILKKVRSNSNHWMNKPWAVQTPFGLVSSFNDWKKEGVPCYSIKRQVHFCSENVVVDKFKIKDKWKVATSKAGNVGNTGVCDISTLFLIEPGAICTQTYIVVNVFDSKKEAENFMSYMKTKFFRFMLGLRTLTQDINKEKFAWVPDVEDYSTTWTDAELFKKFDLTRQEQRYIDGRYKELK